MKIFENEKFRFVRSEHYNYNFNKHNGFFMRWGKDEEIDPELSPYGPEIADIEITTVCSGIPNKSGIGRTLCNFCYKENTPNGKVMSFDTFTKIIEKININKVLTQVAFGLGSTGEENPDLWAMCEWLREKNIIPNGTVADVSDETATKIAKYFGACAISRYSNKDVCYNSVKKLTDLGMSQVNIHNLICEETYEQTLETFNDIKNDPRLSKLNAIVLLSLKKKGRGEKGFTPLSQEKFTYLVNKALELKINFGFDSCSAHKFMSSIKGHKEEEKYLQMAEPCESKLFSVYINVDGNFFPCSFAENLYGGIPVLETDNFINEVWNNNKDKWRETLLRQNRKCPLYEI